MRKLISTLITTTKGQAGNKLSNFLPKSFAREEKATKTKQTKKAQNNVHGGIDSLNLPQKPSHMRKGLPPPEACVAEMFGMVGLEVCARGLA